MAFALAWAEGDEVLQVNEAHAYASCSNCVTVAAIAQQLVLSLEETPGEEQLLALGEVWGRLIELGRTITSSSLSEVAARLEGFTSEILTILGSAPPVASGPATASPSPATGTAGASATPGPSSSAQPSGSASPSPTVTAAPDGAGSEDSGDGGTVDPGAPASPEPTTDASPPSSPDASPTDGASSSP